MGRQRLLCIPQTFLNRKKTYVISLLIVALLLMCCITVYVKHGCQHLLLEGIGGGCLSVGNEGQQMAASYSSAQWSPWGQRKQLLVVSKSRSGSSFTSGLLQNSIQVFFTFEPLHSIDDLIHTRFANSSKVPPLVEDIVQAFLTCDFSLLYNASYLNDSFFGRTASGRDFLICERKPEKRRQNAKRTLTVPKDAPIGWKAETSRQVQDEGFVYLQCLMDLVKDCRSKDVQLSKVIRFPMRWAELFLLKMPKLKMVYLIRDPRAVVYSRAEVFGTFKWPEGVLTEATVHCDMLAEDARELTRLQKLFPGRLKLVRYEEGAFHPYAYAKDLYEFAGLKFTHQTARFVKDLHNPTDFDSTNYYAIKRSNATKVVNKWRHTSGAWAAARIMDAVCQEAYASFGYLPVLSESDLLSTRSLLVSISRENE